MAARLATLVMALALALVSLAACARGSDTPSGIPETALPKTVLQLADLPEPFVQFDEGRQIRTETTGPLRTNPARFGRIDGWKARFRRPGTQTTPGPLVIESRVDLFEAEEGAVKDLVAYRKELKNAVDTIGGRMLTLPALGAEAAGITFREGRVRFFRIAWRQQNATALVFVNGFDGRLHLGDVLTLARKQQRRLEDAGR